MVADLAGSILMSTPYMPDKSMEKSVVLICDASKMGIFGLRINGKLISNEDHDEDLGLDLSLGVYDGGFNSNETFFMVHNIDETVPNDHILICEDWFGVTQLTEETVKYSKMYDQVLITSGYMFWTVSQLKAELKSLYWMIGKATPELLFSKKIQAKWLQALKTNNISLSVLVSQGYNI